MASCPNCGAHISAWNIKAECKKCGVSIPNYNWMERLEEDNKNAEAAFLVFNKTINRMRYSLFGTKLRIVRFVLTFIPALAFIIPWSAVNSGGESFSLTLLSFNGSKSAIDVLLEIINNFSLVTVNIQFEKFAGPATFMFAAVVFYFLSAICIVLAFLFNIIKCAKPKTKSAVTFDIITVIFSVISVILFSLTAGLGAESGAFNFGSLSAFDISGGFLWGYIPALLLFFIAMGINIAVAAAPAKTDEILENERLEKVAAKEAKEREAELKKAIAREEAKKAEEEEQKRVVAEAKRKVAEHKAKKSSKKKDK
ncbi:MAG: DUF1090 domain-containing protein [Clostridiales bacterium]|nr:DUF1090 domain-containing protein [Clostridiales bacterium]